MISGICNKYLVCDDDSFLLWPLIYTCNHKEGNQNKEEGKWLVKTSPFTLTSNFQRPLYNRTKLGRVPQWMWWDSCAISVLHVQSCHWLIHISINLWQENKDIASQMMRWVDLIDMFVYVDMLLICSLPLLKWSWRLTKSQTFITCITILKQNSYTSM
jgi:hypothetical protein